MAASTVTATAQSPAPTPAPAAKSAATAAKPAATPAKPAATATVAASPAIAAIIKVPANIKQYPGVQKPIFTVALRYQEIKIGAGAVAEPNKLYKVLYTGYRASDGAIFDSSELHRQPMKDKDGKPVLGDDGKPKLVDAQPAPFPQGTGTFIIGFDQGYAGMKVGGKRRIFVPWQLAYGTKNIPDRGADHPGIPSKSDLIFDVELVDVTDIPAQPQRPAMSPNNHQIPGGRPLPGTHPVPGAAGTPAQPGAPAAVPAPSAAPNPPSAVAPGQPATPAAPNAAPAPAAVPPAPAAPATPPAK